ncbi:MAG: lysylphosphatidylglycerol synthase domain-containing protein [Alphaproteobacteria bacterium]
MRITVFAAFAVGISLFIGLLLYYGLGDVLVALRAVGWGFFVIALFHLVPLSFDAQAWRLLLDSPVRCGFGQACRIRWIGESVNGLLPAAQIGGEVVRARLATLRGVPLPAAGASVTVDVTLGSATQIAFSLIGLAGLAVMSAESGGTVVWSLTAGLVVFAILILLFFAVQKVGPGRLVVGLIGRLAPRRQFGIDGGQAQALDREIAGIYGRRPDLWRSAAFRFGGWLLGAGEVWLGLKFLGEPIGIGQAVVVESLIQLLRSAAFLVPAALGVQEGGFVLLAAALGLGPETGLALSLIRRVRDLVLGVPGLVAWQVTEGLVARLRRTIL